MLDEKQVEKIKQYLPLYFRQYVKNDDDSMARVYPLLSLLCKDAVLLDKVRDSFNFTVPVQLSESESLAKAAELTDKWLESKVCTDPTTFFIYRLPVVLGEFPIHTRAINQAIRKFNSYVEKYHKDPEEKKPDLDPAEIDKAFREILIAIKEHGQTCDSASLWQLLNLMSGWLPSSKEYVMEFPYLFYPTYKCAKPVAEVKEVKEVKASKLPERVKPTVIESKEPAPTVSAKTFERNSNYNFTRAGRLAPETYTLLLNAFGMKIGGHFDGLAKQPPQFIPIEILHEIIHRQLSHQMMIPQSVFFDIWIEDTLIALGLQMSDGLVNPFLSDPISFLNPNKIKEMLEKTYPDTEEFTVSDEDKNRISEYLSGLLLSFQFNPGQALGIGANHDGTVNLSNDSGSYPFKMSESETHWGERFKQISLHRQGPSEALMDVMWNGLKFELGTIFSHPEYMRTLKPSEYPTVLRNAIIDNLVAELFPLPAYHDNVKYEKFQKQHVVRQNENGDTVIDSFYVPNAKGIFFDKDGEKKQTPMHRRAGTLDVQPFPRKTASCDDVRNSSGNNPHVPLEIQYAQSMYKTVRGHIVYDPIHPDQFLPDAFYGQVFLSENGDYGIYIGVMPKHYDRIFKQDSELCASFVIRMLQSSRIMEYCPTFRENYEQIKTLFLPDSKNTPPELPPIKVSRHIKDLHAKFVEALADPARKYNQCQQVFYSLFRNCIYNLYEVFSTSTDEHYKTQFIQLMTSHDSFYPMTRANADRLIRELTVNRPVSDSATALQHYDATIEYLRKLIIYFYPTPSNEVAEKIKAEADAYIKPLLKSPGIRQYFADQKKISTP